MGTAGYGVDRLAALGRFDDPIGDGVIHLLERGMLIEIVTGLNRPDGCQLGGCWMLQGPDDDGR